MDFLKSSDKELFGPVINLEYLSKGNQRGEGADGEEAGVGVQPEDGEEEQGGGVQQPIKTQLRRRLTT